MENKPVIMIVEDEEAISAFLSAILEANGYRTVKINKEGCCYHGLFPLPGFNIAGFGPS